MIFRRLWTRAVRNGLPAGGLAFLVAMAIGRTAGAARAPIPDRAADPYRGAIVVDARSGTVLFEERADAIGYPASLVKLMNLLLILERVEAGTLKLGQEVRVDAEAAGMGGSQVYLAENELFSVEELLYAMIVQSANDAAVALAKTVAGSKQGFVRLMNKRAQELGMYRTRFHSVHGLPPGVGQAPDISTARDIATLSLEVLKRPDALRYTATKERGFRNNEFVMRTHNALLHSFPGCDGLKTGYFRLAGYSIAATAKRGAQRVVAVVIGSRERRIRNQQAAELLSLGFQENSDVPSAGRGWDGPVALDICILGRRVDHESEIGSIR